MVKILRIGFILATIMISFHGLSAGGPLEKRMPPAIYSQDLINNQWILQQKEDLLFLSAKKAGSGNTLYGDRLIRAIRGQELSMNPEVINALQSPAKADIQKRESSQFENGEPFREKSGYHFGKISLTGNNLDSSINFISSLSLSKHKEENTLSRTLEKLKENDIFKSLAILLEIKLNF